MKKWSIPIFMTIFMLAFVLSGCGNKDVSRVDNIPSHDAEQVLVDDNKETVISRTKSVSGDICCMKEI